MLTVVIRVIDNIILPKIICLCYATVIVIGFAQVLSRYVYNFPLVWVEEVSQLLFIWLTFCGAAVGIRRKAHIRVDFFVGLLPVKMKPFINGFAMIVSLVFMLTFTGLTIKLIHISSKELSYILGIPTSFGYCGIFLGGVFMSINIVRQIKADTQHAQPSGPRNESKCTAG